MTHLDDELSQIRVQATIDYFRGVDSGDPAILDLMTDDVQIYFPKFGIARGKEALAEASAGLLGSLRSIRHDLERMTHHVAGDCVIVEGFEGGEMADGTVWPVAGRSEGRFCNVFAFEGLKISRVFVYVDPDFASTHEERFLWGETARGA